MVVTPASWRREPAAAWVWPIIEHNRAALDRLAAPYGTVAWNELYGCGLAGCVVPILPPGFDPDADTFDDDDPTDIRYVLKVTTDETEGGITQRILNTEAGPDHQSLDKLLDGLCRFEAVYRLPVPGSRMHVPVEIKRGVPSTDTMSISCAFVVIREEIQPFPREIESDLVAAWDQMGDAGWFDPLQAYRHYGRKGDWRSMADAIAALQQYPETALLGATYQTLWAYDILLLDQHFGNLGFRIHDWPGGQDAFTILWSDGRRRPPLLTFDVGFSKYLGKDVDACRTLVRRVNPGLDADIAEIIFVD